MNAPSAPPSARGTRRDEDVDVLIVGAGPAGATAGNLLATAGFRVRILERERFPRFHIGESLLPCDNPVFERLGFDPSAGGFLEKAGAEFVDERTGEWAEHPFDRALPGTPPHAYQVDRARFDEALARLAADRGADVRFETAVTDADVDGADGVTLRSADGATHRARFLLDATGQDAFLGRRRRSITPIRGFGVVAAFTRYEGLAPDVVDELAARGNIKILLLDDGWSWLIPLAGGALSVGVVTRKRGAGLEVLSEVTEGSPLVVRLTRGATRTPPRLIRHFAYLNRHPYGPRYACIGDAGAFLDPMFSSGVSLAMLGAERASDRLADALRRGTDADPDLMLPVGEKMRDAYRVFGSIVKSFYSTGLARSFLLHTDPDPDIHAGLISILAGDVWRDDNAFQDMLLSGRRRRWDPEPLLADPGEPAAAV